MKTPASKPIFRFLRRIGAAQDGAAMVEFGLIAPILGLVFLGIATPGVVVAKYNAMHAAISTGAQYVMAGGGSDTAAVREVTLAAWRGSSPAATIAVERMCRCGATVADCSVLCADASAPKAFVVIQSQDTVDTGFNRMPVTALEEIRVR